MKNCTGLNRGHLIRSSIKLTRWGVREEYRCVPGWVWCVGVCTFAAEAAGFVGALRATWQVRAWLT